MARPNAQISPFVLAQGEATAGSGGSSSGVGLPFSGAMAKLSGDLTGVNWSTNVAMPLDAEEYDIGDWHDNVTLNTRLTVPAGVSKVKLVANVGITAIASSVAVLMHIQMNGGTVQGGSLQRVEVTQTSANVNLATGVIEVVEGDYFECKVDPEADSSVNIVASTTFFSIEAVEVVAPSVTPRGALVKLAADQTAADYTGTVAIPFDAEEYDTDDIHDNVTNKTRLTVPSGVTHVRLTANVRALLNTVNEYAFVEIFKNGSVDWIGMGNSFIEINSSARMLSVTSAIVEVVAGDYFEVFYTSLSDASITVVAARTSFSMEIVAPALIAQGAHKGALATFAADKTGQNFTTAVAIAFDTEEYDTSEIHDLVTNNSRLTVPSGVTKIQLTAQYSILSMLASNWVSIDFRKNGVSGATYKGGVFQRKEISSATTNGDGAVSPVLEVVAGDYFEFFIGVEADTSVDLKEAATWFAMDVRE